MPIYEYECAACGKAFEAIRKFSDPPLESCAECGAPDPKKLISAAAFHLKGTGWYATDYGKSSSKGGPKPETSEERQSDSNNSGDKDKKSGADKDKKSDAGKDKKSESSTGKKAANA